MIYPDTLEEKIGFTKVREALKHKCISPMAVTMVDAMQMMTDYRGVALSLSRTAEMLEIVKSDADIPLGQLRDIAPYLKTIAVGRAFLPADQLAEVRLTLGAISAVKEFFRATMRSEEEAEETEQKSPYPELAEHVGPMATFGGLESEIDRVIDRRGNVLDTASPELSEIRRELSRMSGRVNAVMRGVIARAQKEGVLDGDVTPTMRDGRLVVPVAPMNKRRVSGIVHDESASGKTVFIEPAEVVETNNRIRELELAERREIARVLTIMADAIRPMTSEISASCMVMTELDFIHAKAVFAKEVEGVMPHLSEQPEFEVYHACHPMLLKSLMRQGKEIVQLDITLSKKNRILVISGPNAGGKSVCLKTAAIVLYMTQCGLLPPVYENSHIGIFSDVFIDIGDDQSMESDLSTYSSHLRNMKLLLQRGGKSSFVLIDEFGGGTEPQIGGAIAQAVLRKLNEKGVWGIVTTHFQNLKHFAEETPGLINGSMLYDRQMMQPLFKLSIGNAGSSFAIEIARKTGLPAEIIDEAREIVGSDYVNMDRYLLDIARDRKYWENKRQSIRQKEKKLEQVMERYENDAEQLRSQRREIIAQAKDEAKRIIESSNAEIERTIHEIRRAQADKEQTRQARQQLSEAKNSIDSIKGKVPEALRKAPAKKRKAAEVRPKADRAIEVGDTVKLDGEGLPGKVVELDGKNATVVFGMMKTSVKVSRLKHTLSQVPKASSASSFISTATSNEMRTRQLNFKQDIDVRGMRADEALQAVTYFIDDAIQFNAGRVRILHGTGTGVLRQCIRQYLDTVRGVRSYRDEHVQFGGAGITVVELD